MNNYVHLWCSQNEKYFTQSCTKIKTHILGSITFPENRVVCENVEKCDRAMQVTDDSIIRRIRIACWNTKTTETHSESIILRVFLFHCNKVRRKRLNFTFIRTLPL